MISTDFSSCCAGIYELPLTRLLLGSSFHPGGLALTEELARSVALGPGDTVLDLASGRGDSALHLAKRYGAQVTGLDFSEAQVRESNQRAKAQGISAKVKFLKGDAQALPFEDASFDFVFCECALCTFPARNEAIREALRVLVPGGTFALSDMVINRAIPDELTGVMGHVLCVGGALSEQGYIDALTAGGFSRVRFRDASSVLTQLIDQIEGRIAAFDEWPTSDEAESIPISGEDVSRSLMVAREFVQQGGLGYATFSSRKSSR